ncbi:MAG: hypothetical protein Tsb002_03350 [Wenzhouxiangellaceae bacterium]
MLGILLAWRSSRASLPAITVEQAITGLMVSASVFYQSCRAGICGRVIPFGFDWMADSRYQYSIPLELLLLEGLLEIIKTGINIFPGPLKEGRSDALLSKFKLALMGAIPAMIGF